MKMKKTPVFKMSVLKVKVNLFTTFLLKLKFKEEGRLFFAPFLKCPKKFLYKNFKRR